jgi:formate hydrogenlyase transcriptional activator
MGTNETLAALEERVQLQDLIQEVSAILVDLPPHQVDEQIENALHRIVEFLQIDRSTFGEFFPSRKEWRITHSYAVSGFEPAPKIIASEIIPWMIQMISEGKTLVLKSPDDLPADAIKDRQYWERIGLKTNLTIPFSISGSLLCAIAFGSSRSYRSWPDPLITQLKRVGEIFGHAIYRKRAELRIQNLLQFERVISELSAHFVNIPRNQVDQQIELSLERLLAFFDLDRAALLKVSQNKQIATVTHSANAPGIAAAPLEINYAQQFPWHAKKILASEIVCIDVKDLPLEATADRQAAEAIGIRSNLVIPLFVNDSVDFVFVANAIRTERTFEEEIISRIRLLGEIFVQAIIRKNAEVELAILRNRLEAEAEYLRTEIKVAYHYDEIIGESQAIREVLKKIEQVAPTNSSVLISGETGTGKELVARAIHSLSSRKNRAMVKVSCATLPSSLIENELFGREKGAYTGALTRQTGRFEIADGSTILLDEVGELSMDLQSKLLRVLQEGEFERLGSPRTIKVDVRVIAASNRNLSDAVAKGTFREDLYYRLNVFPIHVPPLRDRVKDIPLLVMAFLKEFRQKVGKSIGSVPKQTMEMLIRYPWPGNIRELRNIIEHGMIISTSDVLRVQLPQGSYAVASDYLTLNEAEKKHITEALEKTRGVIKGPHGAAKILGLQPSTLYNKMKRLGIATGKPRL